MGLRNNREEKQQTEEDIELEQLRKEYNAAIANGLLLKARKIYRVMEAIECK